MSIRVESLISTVFNMWKVKKFLSNKLLSCLEKNHRLTSLHWNFSFSVVLFNCSVIDIDKRGFKDNCRFFIIKKLILTVNINVEEEKILTWLGLQKLDNTKRCWRIWAIVAKRELIAFFLSRNLWILRMKEEFRFIKSENATGTMYHDKDRWKCWLIMGLITVHYQMRYHLNKIGQRAVMTLQELQKYLCECSLLSFWKT